MEPYPQEAFSVIGVQWQRGYQILVMNLYPVEYIPCSGETSYFASIDVTVTTRRSPEGRSSLFRGTPGDRATVAGRIDNTQDLAGYDAAAELREPQTLNGGDDYDYLIITNSALYSAPGPYNFQALKAHKDGRGVLTQIQTVENIYATMAGADNQERYATT